MIFKVVTKNHVFIQFLALFSPQGNISKLMNFFRRFEVQKGIVGEIG